MAKIKVLKSDAHQRLGRLNDALTDLLVDNTFNKHGINMFKSIFPNCVVIVMAV